MRLICLDVVPEETRPWKPLMAPQAMVTNKRGNIEGAPSPLGRKAGASTTG